jgi:hypothetical protein
MHATSASAASLVLLLLTATSALEAQQCSPPPHPLFDFQVTRPAEFLPDSSLTVRPAITPAEERPPQRVVIQFVVDTLGVPDSASFRVLIAADSTLLNASRRVFRDWRFRPALLNGCPVPQAVQTAVHARAVGRSAN